MYTKIVKIKFDKDRMENLNAGKKHTHECEMMKYLYFCVNQSREEENSGKTMMMIKLKQSQVYFRDIKWWYVGEVNGTTELECLNFRFNHIKGR